MSGPIISAEKCPSTERRLLIHVVEKTDFFKFSELRFLVILLSLVLYLPDVNTAYTLLTFPLNFLLPGGLNDSYIIGGDTSKMTQLNSWLHSRLQSASKSYWRRCYRASQNGWYSRTFHRQCDNLGPTVTIIRAHGYIFGGYTDKSWQCT